MGSEEVNERHDDQPGEDAAGKEHARNLGSNDVPHPQVFRGSGYANRRTLEESGLIVGLIGPGGEQVGVLEERVNPA
jgi:hypothetical protein